jgi:lactobin A/cerein 7B family class IIb bacteriocin
LQTKREIESGTQSFKNKNLFINCSCNEGTKTIKMNTNIQTNKTNGFQELSMQELEDVNGGLVLALAGLALTLFCIGYQMGKDRAEVDRMQ